jgi:hypothetical protein
MPDDVRVQVDTLDSGLTEGARRATGVSPESPAASRGAVEHHRWTASRRRDVVLRLLRGESLDAVSRDTAVEIYRLEHWKGRALAAMEAGLRERGGDPREAELEDAQKKIGELSMEVELLRKRCQRQGAPFSSGRLRK